MPDRVEGMGFLDDAKNLVNQHDEQVDQALEKGGEFGKERFAGHDAQIDDAIDRAQAATGQGDTVPDEPAGSEPAPPPAQP
jgi:hypothetical protein